MPRDSTKMSEHHRQSMSNSASKRSIQSSNPSSPKPAQVRTKTQNPENHYTNDLQAAGKRSKRSRNKKLAQTNQLDNQAQGQAPRKPQPGKKQGPPINPAKPLQTVNSNAPRSGSQLSKSLRYTSIPFEAHGKAHFSDWNSLYGVADVIYRINPHDWTNPLAGKIEFVKIYGQKKLGVPNGIYEIPTFSDVTIDHWKVVGHHKLMVKLGYEAPRPRQASPGVNRMQGPHRADLCERCIRNLPCRGQSNQNND